MTKNDPRPLVPYLRQSRAKEGTISIEEQRRDIEVRLPPLSIHREPDLPALLALRDDGDLAPRSQAGF